jgi:hypothetical protein
MLTLTMVVQGAFAGALDGGFFDVLRVVRFLLPGEEPLLRLPLPAVVRLPHHGLRIRGDVHPRLLIVKWILQNAMSQPLRF